MKLIYKRRSWVSVALMLGLSGCMTPPPAPLPSAASLNQFQPVQPEDKVAAMEEQLRTQAVGDALLIARNYARSDRQIYPGIQALGEYLLFEVEKYYPPFSFQEAVSHNPRFWRAALELSPQDVSFPYLVASLAVIGKDYATARRIIALAQASLPLGSSLRRAYALPEAMLGYRELLLVQDLPPVGEIESRAECDRLVEKVRHQLAATPGSLALMSYFVDLRVRGAALSPKTGDDGGGGRKLGELLAGETELVAAFRRHDPITADALGATVADWNGKRTLLQKWVRWSDYSEPAELADVEKSVAACEQAGRPDLAWLNWRFSLVLRGIPQDKDRTRWEPWSKALLKPDEAAQLAALAPALRHGTAMMSVLPEGPSEAWLGGSDIHPLLVIQAERGLALDDAMLANATPGSKQEGELRLKRAEKLADVRAVGASREELARAEQILGRTADVQAVDITLLAIERRFTAVDALYAPLLAAPAMDRQLRFQYAIYLYMVGRYAEAAVQYHELAKSDEDDVYMVIMAELAERRLGGGNREALLQAKSHVEAGSWQEAGLRFLLGELSEEQLLETARRGGVFDIVQHECEGYFWLAQLALAQGDTQGGIQWLRKCVGSGFTAFIEHRIATEELVRLVPADKLPPRQGPARNSHGVEPA